MVKRAIEKLKTNPGSVYGFSLVFVAAALSLVASFVLSVEAINLAQNPGATLSCDINAVISCGAVAAHPSSTILGFPNSFIGMMFEPVFITIAVLVLAGVRLPSWILRGAQWGATAALAFAAWMFYTSYFVIGALCPWCLVVSFSTIVLWFALTRFTIIHKVLYLPARMKTALEVLVAKDYDKAMMWLVIVVLAGAIIVKYGASIF